MKKTILLSCILFSLHSYAQMSGLKPDPFVMSDIYGIPIINRFHEYVKKEDENFKFIQYSLYARDADSRSKYWSVDDPKRVKFLDSVIAYLKANVTIPPDWLKFGGHGPQYKLVIDTTGHVISLDTHDVYRPAKSKEDLEAVDRQVLDKLSGFKFMVPDHPTNRAYFFEFNDVINFHYK
jgi:hypothetical protein